MLAPHLLVKKTALKQRAGDDWKRFGRLHCIKRQWESGTNDQKHDRKARRQNRDHTQTSYASLWDVTPLKRAWSLWSWPWGWVCAERTEDGVRGKTLQKALERLHNCENQSHHQNIWTVGLKDAAEGNDESLTLAVQDWESPLWAGETAKAADKPFWWGYTTIPTNRRFCLYAARQRRKLPKDGRETSFN